MLFNFICRTILTPTKPYIKLSPFHQSSLFTTKSSNPHSCGLPPESPNTAGSVLTFLNNQGLTKSQVSKLITSYPKILLHDPEKTLLPNFQILKNIGLSKTEVNAIVTARPKAILNIKFQETAPCCVNYLRNVLGSDDRVMGAVKRYPLGLTYDLEVYAVKNVRMLLELGVPSLMIQNMLARQPRTFFTSVERFRKVVREVMEMGFDPSKLRFLYAIHAIRAMSRLTWDKKMEVYKKWGWSEDEIFIAFERYPGCMMASVDKISRILDFLVNTMGWERSFIVERPIVICFSLEKRVIPRCLVYQYVAEKGLVEEKEDFCFTKWLMYSETKFLKWVVKKYENEASEILKLYRKHLNEASGSATSILRKRDVISV